MFCYLFFVTTPVSSPEAELPANDLGVRCVARWIEQGLTSKSNPVLDHALKTYVGPVGIVCEALEFEPFGVLEGGAGGLHFHRPAFVAAAVTQESLRALVRRYPSVAAEIAVSGHAFFRIPAGAGDGASLDTDSSAMAYAVAEALDRARQFLLAAAATLVDEEAPEVVKTAYLSGDMDTFCVFVEQQLQP